MRARLEEPQLAPSDALVLCRWGVNKLIAFHPDLSPEELVGRSQALVADSACVTYSGAPFLELGAREVSKASALISYCAARAIDRTRVLALGDMPNDLSMLTWAGRGIAMAKPKSTSFAVKPTLMLPSTMMLLVFKSQCTNPAMCVAARASQTCINTSKY